MDCEAPPLLCRYSWSPKARYLGEATTAEERLYREGKRVVPILIDRLVEEEDPSRRLALGALLHDLTGFHRPFFVGPFRDEERWPTWDPRWKPTFDPFRFRTLPLTEPEQMLPAWRRTRTA